MDYEQKYKEALEKARIWKDKSGMPKYKQGILDDIFPELRESEDERIGKELIQFIKNWKNPNNIGRPHDFPTLTRDVEQCDKYIAWLEKQGEQKLPIEKLSSEMKTIGESLGFTTQEECDKYNQMVTDLIMSDDKVEPKFKVGDIIEYVGERKELIDGKYEIKEIGNDFYVTTRGAIIPFKFEEYYINKTKPKFNVGDWVVTDKNNVVQIKAIEDSRYVLENAMKFSVCYVDKCWRKWTIQDAKDGDVLCYKDEISLYKHDIKNCTKQETTFGGFVYHCCYDGRRFITDSLYSLTEQDKMDIHPATKEQRDLLFQKMNESGYVWDAEKKELKKIEPIDEYEGLTDFERTLADICIGWIGKEIGWKEYIKNNADVLLKIAVEKFNSVQDAPFEQKPTDEEMKTLLRTEYEKIRESLLEYLHTLPNHYTHGGVCVLEWIAWLEKQGFQKPTDEEMKEALRTEYEKGRADAIAEIQKLAWSEEDEMIFKRILQQFMAANNDCKLHNASFTYDKEISFLKSLKDRVQPKQEWSKEDIRNMEDIDSALFYDKDLPEDTCVRLRNWLTTLRPQNIVGYNPYKEAVDSIAEMCKHYDIASHSGLRDFYDNVKVKCKDAKEYDSLYPQNCWKPSDVQMKALDDALSLAKNCGEENAFDLRTLYEQLKKLKKE